MFVYCWKRVSNHLLYDRNISYNIYSVRECVCAGMQSLVSTCNRSRGVALLMCPRWKYDTECRAGSGEETNVKRVNQQVRLLHRVSSYIIYIFIYVSVVLVTSRWV